MGLFYNHLHWDIIELSWPLIEGITYFISYPPTACAQLTLFLLFFCEILVSSVILLLPLLNEKQTPQHRNWELVAAFVPAQHANTYISFRSFIINTSSLINHPRGGERNRAVGELLMATNHPPSFLSIHQTRLNPTWTCRTESLFSFRPYDLLLPISTRKGRGRDMHGGGCLENFLELVARKSRRESLMGLFLRI